MPATAASTGRQWEYEVKEDKMTGAPTRYAWTSSTNTHEFGFPYQGSQHATLALRRGGRFGKDVIPRIERGQLMERSCEDSTALIRFDDGKPERFCIGGVSSGTSEVAFIQGYERFVQKLRKAKTIRIAMEFYQHGSPIWEFDVSWFDYERHSK